MTLLALTLAGCAVGPKFTAPEAPKVQSYGSAPLPAQTSVADTKGGDAQRFVQGQDVPDQWWTVFGNQELDQRIQEAIAHNPNLASARASLRQAQENLSAAKGGRFPSVDATAGVNRAKLSAATTAPGATGPYTVYNASASVSYTLDLFGSVRRGVEAKEAQVDYQRWTLRGAYLSLAANVATATFQEAALQSQIEATEAVVKLLQEQSDLAGKQFAIGVKSQGDLLAVQSQLASAQAALAPQHAALAALRNQLAVYLGRFPSEANLGGAALDGFTLPGDIPVSLPSKVVDQRPDIQAADAQLHAATAQVGIATANLLPQITLGGSYGSSALKTGDLFNADTTAWNLGANLFQPIFHGGSLRAQKRAAEAGLDAASANYQASVLNAFRNVSDTLNVLQFDADALQAQTLAEQSASKSLDLVKAQYRLGAASYIQLLDATRQWQTARIAFIQARAARLSDTAALYAALGGGWQGADDSGAAPRSATTAH